MTKHTIRLSNEAARSFALRMVQEAPFDYCVVIQESSRTLMQNARLHAMLTDISRQLSYLGQRRTVDFWKGLFVSGWQVATGQTPEIVPGLEGEFINLRTSTTSLGIKDLGSLMEYISAYAADQGVKFSACEWQQ